jgi:hypothetical protein
VSINDLIASPHEISDEVCRSIAIHTSLRRRCVPTVSIYISRRYRIMVTLWLKVHILFAFNGASDSPSRQQFHSWLSLRNYPMREIWHVVLLSPYDNVGSRLACYQIRYFYFQAYMFLCHSIIKRIYMIYVHASKKRNLYAFRGFLLFNTATRQPQYKFSWGVKCHCLSHKTLDISNTESRTLWPRPITF